MNESCLFGLHSKLHRPLRFVLLFILFQAVSFAQDKANNPRYIETMSVLDKVESTNNFAGNLNVDSSSTLPFGIVKEIGTTRYVIAIDSAVFLPGIAMYSAYMAIEFPGSTERIAFMTKNVAFNPKGVIPGNNTRLMLACDQKINIGPKIQLVLKGDGSNYVEWDCNGFKAIRLKGNFEFHNTMLIPDPGSTTDSTVKATFDIYTSDVHNFVTQVAITPFSIKGLSDVHFSIVDATVDMSEVSNAPGMVFPAGYQVSSIGPDPKMWTGFYLKYLKIKLPKEISRDNTPTELSASNFFIDKTGISGNFQAANLFSTSENSMSGWGFSLEQIGLNFVSNVLNGGNFSGRIKLPLNNFDDLAYTAAVFQDPQTEQTDFLFSVSPATNYNAKVLSAGINIYPTTKITIQRINGKLKPTADINGKITFSSSDMRSPSLEVQNLVLTTDVPYLKSGIFSFTNGSSSGNAAGKLGGFNISLNSISLLTNSSSPGIGFNAGFSFTSKDDNAFGTSATFMILTKIGPNSTPGSNWEFDRISVNDITLDVQTCAAKFSGMIKYFDNNPTYGKGFFGSMTLNIPGVMTNPATANAWFGAKDDFNYFYFDLAIPITQVLIEPSAECPEGLAIYRFMGGLYYKMRPSVPNQSSQLYTPAFGTAQNYIPDSTILIGLKGGVTLGTYPNNAVLNGDVAFEVNFTPSGGLGTVTFSGTAFMFVKISDRVPVPKANAPVKASLTVTYDFQKNTFDALLNTDINLQAVTAHGQAEIYIDAKDWFVCFGKPENRINVVVANLATLHAYFMLGNQIEGVPYPPQQVANVFHTGFTDTRDKTKLSSGSGFAFGASLDAGANGQFGWSNFSVYYNLGFTAGFDLMANDYGSKAHCSGSTDAAGFNGWYAQGNVYAALWGNVGAKGHYAGEDFDIQLLSLSAAALLNGKFPNPSHVVGYVHVDYNFLKVFKGNFNFNFEAGNNCNIVTN